MTSSELPDPGTPRDPDRPGRLLRAEHDALLPILHRTPEASFDNPTACPGWSVRDVLAHCGSALHRAMTGDLHAFTPEENEIDVAERRSWPLQDVLSELAAGYLGAWRADRQRRGPLDVLRWASGSTAAMSATHWASHWPMRAKATTMHAPCSPSGHAAGRSLYSRSTSAIACWFLAPRSRTARRRRCIPTARRSCGCFPGGLLRLRTMS